MENKMKDLMDAIHHMQSILVDIPDISGVDIWPPLYSGDKQEANIWLINDPDGLLKDGECKLAEVQGLYVREKSVDGIKVSIIHKKDMEIKYRQKWGLPPLDDGAETA